MNHDDVSDVDHIVDDDDIADDDNDDDDDDDRVVEAVDDLGDTKDDSTCMLVQPGAESHLVLLIPIIIIFIIIIDIIISNMITIIITIMITITITIIQFVWAISGRWSPLSGVG